MIKNTSLLATCLIAALTLPGCESFDVKFNPEEAAWTEQTGNKTLILHAYMMESPHKETSCDSLARNAILTPDTPYYRDWIRVIDSPLRFKASVDKESQNFGRIASYQDGCIFTFTDLPAGKWLVFTAMQHHVKAYPISIGNYYAGSSTMSAIHRTWAALEITPDESVIKKNIVFNREPKIKDVPQSEGLNLPESHLSDWTAEENATLHYTIIPSTRLKDYNLHPSAPLPQAPAQP